MNRNYKITLSVVLVLIMIINSVPMLAANALEALETSDEAFLVRDFVVEDDKETAAEDGTVYWSYTETDTEATLTYCDTTGTEVTIPSVYRGKPVVAIAANAFNGATGLANLKTVNIASTVQKIESKAFKNCALLSAVNFLPFEGVTGDAAVPDISEICSDAFYNCAALKAITVPKGVVTIGAHAFGFTYASSAYKQISGFIVFGYLNTAVYKYANDNSICFSNLYGAQTVTPVQTFTVSPGQGTVNIGEFIQLTPVFGATTPTNTFVRWFSSDKTIAVVSKTGKVTGISSGQATITATSSDNIKTATCALTINGSSSGTNVTIVEFADSLAATTVTAYYSSSSTLKYKVTYNTSPADAPYNNVAFTYDDTYFTVEYDTTAECYYLIPKKITSGNDTVQLKIYSVAYPSTVFDTVNIKIINEITGVQWYSFTANDGIPFNVTNYDSVRWKASEGRLSFVVKLLPSNVTATMDDITISSSNENVAYWNANNQLVPVMDGTTILTVTTINGGYTDTIRVTLSGTGLYAVMGLSFSFGITQELTNDKTYDLKGYLTFAPTMATNKNVTWKSSDTSIFSVTTDGVVTCHNRGMAVITATSEENDDVVATATIKVMSNDPYIIETVSQLLDFASSVNNGSNLNNYIKLENDIVLNPPDVFTCYGDGNITGIAVGKTPNTWTPIGGCQPLSISNSTQFNAAKSTYGTLYYKSGSSYYSISYYDSSYSTYYYRAVFRGTFDGCGHTVSGIYIDTASDYQGLFGYASGTIKNVGVINSYIKGGSYVGGVVGTGSVINCYNTGSVTGSDYVGGVAGTGSVINCYNTGNVTGSEVVGGVAGEGEIIDNCYNKGTVTGILGVGGIAGSSEGVINISYNTGSVTGDSCVGGVSGAGSLINSYNSGSVTGSGDYVGGTAGYSLIIYNCYNTGSVTGSGDYVGGVTGASYMFIRNGYYLSGTATGGINGSDIAGQAEVLTIAQMKNAVNFKNWDFHNVWAIDNTNGYEFPQIINYLDKSLGEASAIWDGTAADGFAGGTGKVTDPYRIETPEQLAYLANTVNGGNSYAGKHIKLSNDIAINNYIAKYWTLNANEWTSIGTSENGFKGIFDGGGHTVSGIYMTKGMSGLFGLIDGGTVKNVTVGDSYITTSFKDISLDDFDEELYLSGYIAAWNAGDIINCHNNAAMHSFYACGIAGRNMGTISNCYNTGIMTGGGVSGIAALNEGTISNCYNTADITGFWGSGIALSNDGLLSNCYNSGDVTGIEGSGGVAGYNSGTVRNSYNNGSVTGYGNAGGVVGDNSDTVSNCYYLAGTATGGIDGRDVADQAEALTDTRMRQQASFSGWDFETVWTMDGNPIYPYPELTGMSHGGESVTSVTITSDDFEIAVGGTRQLFATVLPFNATDKSVTWSSSDESVATVDENGLVTAKAAGTAMITVTANDTTNGTISDTCELTVVSVALTKIEIKTLPNKTSYYVGNTLNTTGLTLMATYNNGTSQTIMSGFTCSPTSLNTTGTQTITVTYDGKTCTFDVTVSKINASGFLIEAIPDQTYTGNEITPTVVVKYNGETLTLNTDYTLTFTNNTNVGTVTVTVTGIGNYTGTKTATFKIISSPIAVTGITLSSAALTLQYKGTSKLTVTFSPINATNKNVTWTSSNEKVAIVDAYGNVTAKGSGTATITATSEDGGYTAQCTVTVKIAWWQWLIKILLFGWIWY